MRRPHLFSLVLSTAIFLADGATAQPSLEAELSGPIEVELRDGRRHSGHPVSFRDDLLTIRIAAGGGELEQGFPRDTIAKIHFSGAATERTAVALVAEGQLQEAIPFLEGLWRQRAPFLALLDAESLDLLSALPGAQLEGGDAYRAISLAKLLLPHAKSSSISNRLQEAILVGHFDLELFEEADALAHGWIRQQDKFPDSALGWRILAELALAQKDYDRVLWVALQPIAVAGPLPMDNIEDCYALAIHAYHLLEAPEEAAMLFLEMSSLNLPWPQGRPDFAATEEIYRHATEQGPEEEAPPPGPDLDLRPPEQDLNLPIRAIRKLLQQADT